MEDDPGPEIGVSIGGGDIEEEYTATRENFYKICSSNSLIGREMKTKFQPSIRGFLDVLEEPKVLNSILQCLHFRRMLPLRLLCKRSDKIISSSSLFLEGSKIVVHDVHGLEYFENSKVQWRRIVLGYWPQPNDRFVKGIRTYKFWETKANSIIDFTYRLHPYIKITYYEFYEIFMSLTNLESFTVASTLSQFKLYHDLGLSGRLMLRQTFSNVKHIYFENMFQVPGAYKIFFENHIQNCSHLVQMIPLHQLETIYVSSGPTDRTECSEVVDVLASFVLHSVRHHVSSLKKFKFEQIIPTIMLSEICVLEGLQLEALTVDLLSSISIFEKGKIKDDSKTQAYFQVKTWRYFHQFLSRQEKLSAFAVSIQQMSRKIAKQLFPENLQRSLKNLYLAIQEIDKEETLRFFSKLIVLTELSLDLNNAVTINQNISKSNVFSVFPTSLTSLTLAGISYPPAYLISLVQRLTQIRLLRFYNASFMLTDESVQAIIQYLPHLQDLHMAPAFQIGDDGFLGKYNISSLIGLNHLMIRDSKITNSTVRRGFHFKELGFLDISGCTKVTHRGIMDLPKQNPNLLCLQISGIEFLPSARKKLMTKYPNLYLLKSDLQDEPSSNSTDATQLSELPSLLPDNDHVYRQATQKASNDCLPPPSLLPSGSSNLSIQLDEETELIEIMKKRGSSYLALSKQK